MPADRLIIFAREPRAGKVKTRLSPPLSHEDAASLYAASLRDVVAAAAHERARLELWYDDGPGAVAYFETHFPHVLRHEQGQGDLGVRLARAFARSFADEARRVAVIGSDAPTLPIASYGAAFDALHDADAVIGPTVDGGYYLVGIAAGAWPRAGVLFEGVPWSTDAVYATTLENARRASLDLRALPGWYDIDVAEDLRRARSDLEPDSHLGRWFATMHAAGRLPE